jgi:hypothetical protein
MNQRFIQFRWVLLICFIACDSKPPPDEQNASADAELMFDDQMPHLDATVDAQAPAEDAGESADLATVDAPDATLMSDKIYVGFRGDDLVGSGVMDDPYASLQVAIDVAEDGATIQIGPGFFRAEPHAGEDPTCGNCDDSTFLQPVPITIGYSIRGKSLHLRGDGRERTTLYTGAGYGLYFDEAGISSIEDLKITGGVRDADGKATDAGIVVRYTHLTVRNVDIIGNDDLYTGEPDPVVGIMGITGREGSRLSIEGCKILDNSWDGITLYRSDLRDPDSQPQATIINNEIGCTSNCVNPRGRGVGVGVTWDAEATVINNHVHHYWKGIGAFGTTQVTVANNIVEHQVGWGIIATGESTMNVLNNIIAHNGTTGLAAWNPEVNARFVNNIVWNNGIADDEWVGKRTGLWLNAPQTTELTYNNIWGNHHFEACRGGTPGQDDCVAVEYDGVDGNMAVDPEFSDTTPYRLDSDSPLIDRGDPMIQDTDDSRSDIGLYGGPEAGRTEL